MVEVEDTGRGIPPSHLDRIWQPFFTTKPLGQGNGLGLSICKDLLARFGGHVGVRSREGAGSVFTVRLRAGSPGGAGGSPT